MKTVIENRDAGSNLDRVRQEQTRPGASAL